MEKEKKYLKKLLKYQDKCILALSGGPDSMYLLHLLLEVKKEIEIDIVCVHINHNTRLSCETEKEFVESYLKKYNIPLYYYKIDEYKKNRFTEEEARKKRYQILQEVCIKEQAKYLFTAHHGDDLTETIFMRVLRGSSLEGYAGIKKELEWNQIQIIRPLLTKKKSEILNELEKEKIPYCIDESNQSDKYLRNRIRKTVLPILEKENPNYHQKFKKFSNTLLEANQFIQTILKELETTLEINNKIKLSEFKKYSIEVQKYYLRYYFKKVYQKDLDKIQEKHINNSLKIIYNNKKECYVDIPGNKKFIKDNEFVYISLKKEIQPFCFKCEQTVELPNGYLQKQENYTEKSNYEIHLNSKDIVLPLYVTTRKQGMKMAVKNLNGTKSISNILTDSKIKKEDRDQIPILVDSKGTVLWVLGIKKSKYDLEKDEFYDIIYKYVKGKEE